VLRYSYDTQSANDGVRGWIGRSALVAESRTGRSSRQAREARIGVRLLLRADPSRAANTAPLANHYTGHVISGHIRKRRGEIPIACTARQPTHPAVSFPGGFRTTAPVPVARIATGRHPKPFTEAEVPPLPWRTPPDLVRVDLMNSQPLLSEQFDLRYSDRLEILGCSFVAHQSTG
jgi:hypothetical protein